MLSFYVPTTSTSSVTAAIFKTGAGIWPEGGGLYSECCFISSGTGQFRPNEGANPNIGHVGGLEKVDENKVDVICVGRECMRNAVSALKEAHPYEVVAYYVVKMEDV